MFQDVRLITPQSLKAITAKDGSTRRVNSINRQEPLLCRAFKTRGIDRTYALFTPKLKHV